MADSLKPESSDNHAAPPLSPGEIIIGRLVGLDEQGYPLVDYPANPETQPLTAQSTVPLTAGHAGRQVALLFANADPRLPVVMGLIQNPLDGILETFELTEVDTEKQGDQSDATQIREEKLYVDGREVCIEGKDEVTFKCGKASITLTKAGKIIIRGTYLLNRSSGVNRILGGSVQIN